MQGTAADLIKLSMIATQGWIEESGVATRMVMQVHDELVLEVPEAEVSMVEQEVPRLMASVAALAVPLTAEVGVGANWVRLTRSTAFEARHLAQACPIFL